MKKLTSYFFLLLFGYNLSAQQVINLYEGKTPGSETWTWSEGLSTKNMFNTEVVYNVVEPSLTVYLPPKDLATGTAVIIAPGGAFHTLSINSEGIDVAKYLNSKGIAAFVLKYRLTRSITEDPVAELMAKMGDFKKLDEANANTVKLATADGIKAMQYVRQHAADFDINPSKIGFMGFSAGGTLTMSVAYTAETDSKPNFIAPIYAYAGAILGSDLPIVKTPIFVAVAADDQLGLMPHSIDIFNKWNEAKHPAELHVFEKGGHGFGMRIQNLPTDHWAERFTDWLKLQGYLKKLYPNKYEKLYGEDAVAANALLEPIKLKNDYANLARYKNKKATPDQTILIGDSITEGWYAADSGFFKSNKLIGRGISGQTSSQLLLRFKQDVLDHKPKAVVIHIGTNDVAENTGPYVEANTLSNIQTMIDLAKSKAIKVVLASVLPATKFEWRRSLGNRSAEIVALNARLKALALSNKILYLDYHTQLKNSENGMDPDLAEDGVHPSKKAFGIMGKMLVRLVK